MQNPEMRSKSMKANRRISLKCGSSEMFQKELSQGGSSGLLHLVKTSPRYLDPTVSSLNLAGKASKERIPRFSDQTRRFSENFQEKLPIKVTEMESHISQLETKLDIVKDQLISAELLKKEAQKDAENSRNQLLVLLKKYEKSRKIVSDSVALFSAFDEIRLLNTELESAAVFKAESNRKSESNQKQLHQLKEQLQNACLVSEELQNETNEAKKSEARALEIIDGTLMQVVESNVMAEILKAETYEVTAACDAVASELEHSRKPLEEANLSVELQNVDVGSLKLEVEGLKSALEGARIRYDEDLFQKQEETENAVEIMKIIKFASEQTQDELETEIRRSKSKIDELTTNLLDMETKLESSYKKNAILVTQINGKLSSQRKNEMEIEIYNAKAEKDTLKAHMIVKEIELENAATERRTLELWVKEMNEETERNIELEQKKTEEFKDVTRENREIECELRKVKMQLEQWRKAAEVAASIIYAENDGMLVRLSYGEEDMQKKRNSKLLRKFSLLWKKQK